MPDNLPDPLQNFPAFMVFAKSLDASTVLRRTLNANYAKRANFAKAIEKFASFAFFATFALKISDFAIATSPHYLFVDSP